MSSVNLPNGKYISSNILEITAFPKAEIIDNDNKKAFEMNMKAFNQMLFELHKISDMNSTVAEILWVSEKVENQTFKSKVRVFVVIRKIGTDINLLDKETKTIQSNFISELNQVKFETRPFELEDKSFINLVRNIDFSSLLTITKKEKIVGNSASYGNYYTWDILNNNSNDTMSGFISSISQNSNCAVSFQIIPTSLSSNELIYLNELSVQYKQVIGMGDISAEIPLKTNQYLLDRSQKPLFFYNICTFGNVDCCRFITTKLLSVLQSGNEKISDCDLITLDLSSEKINIANQFYIYPWIINEKLINKYRNAQLQQYPIVKAMGRFPYVMTLEELNVFFRLPLYDKSMPALTERKALSDAEQFSKDIIGENTIKFGRLISDGGSEVVIGCPLKSWTQHALIVGMPGTGKTTFAVNILTQFYKKGIPFLAIEPTKSEYRAMIDIVDDLQIFTPGNNNVSPFIINPFIPPKGITVEQYIPSLLAAFKAAFSMDGPLEMIFLKAVNNCYIEYGWKKYSKYGDKDVKVFGMFEYILCFKKTMNAMNYNKETKSNIETAGLLRLMNLIEQNSNIYDTINTVPIEDLLSKPTVLELNSIDNDEQKSLIMALILSSACVHIKNNQIGDGKLKNVILIDEAHVLLDSGVDSEGSGSSKGTTVKTVQKMIALSSETVNIEENFENLGISVVGEIKTQNPDSSHHHEPIYKTVYPTCSEYGYIEFTCRTCDVKFVTKYICPTKHKFTEKITPATIESDGHIVTVCTVCGYIKEDKIINKIYNASLDYSSAVYDKYQFSPNVNVVDSSGKSLVQNVDYIYTLPLGRKSVGIYTYDITYLGNYKGTSRLLLFIYPQSPIFKKIVLSKNEAELQWNKITAQNDGYEVQYSTNPHFILDNHYITVNNKNAKSLKLPNLKSKRRYYFRIRSFKNVNESNVFYSQWSRIGTAKML